MADSVKRFCFGVSILLYALQKSSSHVVCPNSAVDPCSIAVGKQFRCVSFESCWSTLSHMWILIPCGPPGTNGFCCPVISKGSLPSCGVRIPRMVSKDENSLWRKTLHRNKSSKSLTENEFVELSTLGKTGDETQNPNEPPLTDTVGDKNIKSTSENMGGIENYSPQSESSIENNEYIKSTAERMNGETENYFSQPESYVIDVKYTKSTLENALGGTEIYFTPFGSNSGNGQNTKFKTEDSIENNENFFTRFESNTVDPIKIQSTSENVVGETENHFIQSGSNTTELRNIKSTSENEVEETENVFTQSGLMLGNDKNTENVFLQSVFSVENVRSVKSIPESTKGNTHIYVSKAKRYAESNKTFKYSDQTMRGTEHHLSMYACYYRVGNNIKTSTLENSKGITEGYLSNSESNAGDNKHTKQSAENTEEETVTFFSQSVSNVEDEKAMKNIPETENSTNINEFQIEEHVPRKKRMSKTDDSGEQNGPDRNTSLKTKNNYIKHANSPVRNHKHYGSRSYKTKHVATKKHIETKGIIHKEIKTFLTNTNNIKTSYKDTNLHKNNKTDYRLHKNNAGHRKFPYRTKNQHVFSHSMQHDTPDQDHAYDTPRKNTSGCMDDEKLLNGSCNTVTVVAVPRFDDTNLTRELTHPQFDNVWSGKLLNKVPHEILLPSRNQRFRRDVSEKLKVDIDFGISVTEQENDTTKEKNSDESREVVQSDPLYTIGGRIEDQTWPWIVSIYEYPSGKFICGGTLIDFQHVVSAAHCFYYLRKDMQYQVIVGNLHLAQGLTDPPFNKVRQLFSHEGFFPECHCNDIAILRLEQPLDAESHTPICLTRFDTATVGQTTTILGWGDRVYRVKDNSDGYSTTRLQRVDDLIIVPSIFCKRRMEMASNMRMSDSFPEQFICAGVPDGQKDGCTGDSGGPLLHEDYDGIWSLLGVISFGYKCGIPGVPGTYSRISYYLPWIEKIVSL